MMSSNNENKKVVYLHWAEGDNKSSTAPCFCNPTIYLNIERLKATPETIGALFGITDPSNIAIKSRHGGSRLDLIYDENGTEDEFWPLEEGNEYEVEATSKSDNDDVDSVVPIKKIFALIPGDTGDDKSDRLQELSNNFYDKIWNDPTVPDDFRSKFYSPMSSEKIQAFRQYDWLYEVFGGPEYEGELLGNRESLLVKKVMAKHTTSRMTSVHAITWLKLMARSIQEVFPDQPKIRHVLGLYWLHFYGFFPFSDHERREFRKIVLEEELTTK